jgi:hypothetical protein
VRALAGKYGLWRGSTGHFAEVQELSPKYGGWCREYKSLLEPVTEVRRAGMTLYPHRQNAYFSVSFPYLQRKGAYFNRQLPYLRS